MSQQKNLLNANSCAALYILFVEIRETWFRKLLIFVKVTIDAGLYLRYMQLRFLNLDNRQSSHTIHYSHC